MEAKESKGIVRTAREWVVHKGKYHLVDSTSLVTVTTPIFAAFETYIIRIPNAASTNARLLAMGLSCAGMSSLYSKGRNLIRKALKITDQTKEKTQARVDSLYTGAFNLCVSPVIYKLCGVDDPKKLATSVAIAVGFGLFSGPLMGYAVDVGRDFTGLGECNRRAYPKIVKERGKWAKRAIATGLVAASLMIWNGIYELGPDRLKTQVEKPGLERVVNDSGVVKEFSVEYDNS